MSEGLDKLIAQEQRRAMTVLMLKRICVNSGSQDPLVQPKQMPPHMRPHTYIFLRGQLGDRVPVTLLGVVFHTWPMKKFNMIRFTAHGPEADVHESARLVTLDNGAPGLVLNVRWPWETMLKKYRGLSAGNL